MGFSNLGLGSRLVVEGLRLRRSLRLQFQDLMLGLGFTQELKARRTLKPKPTPKADRALRQNNLYIPYSSRGTTRLGRNGRRLRQRKVLSKMAQGFGLCITNAIAGADSHEA